MDLLPEPGDFSDFDAIIQQFSSGKSLTDANLVQGDENENVFIFVEVYSFDDSFVGSTDYSFTMNLVEKPFDLGKPTVSTVVNAKKVGYQPRLGDGKGTPSYFGVALLELMRENLKAKPRILYEKWKSGR